MANKKRILFISQEIAPYITDGASAAYGRTLPVKMQERGFEVRTFMPKFGLVNERRNQLHEVIRLSGVNIVIKDDDHPLIVKVASMQPSRIQVYFIDNDDYFIKEDSDADYSGSNRADNDERCIFYSRGALETAKKLRWEPKVINVSGWISSLIPMYLRRAYSDEGGFKGSKVVFTIMPEKITTPLPDDFFDKLKADGISQRDLKKFSSLPLDGDLLTRMAVEYSHAVIVKDPEISNSLLEYIRESGKPMLMACDLADDSQEYTDFLNSLN